MAGRVKGKWEMTWQEIDPAILTGCKAQTGQMLEGWRRNGE